MYSSGTSPLGGARGLPPSAMIEVPRFGATPDNLTIRITRPRSGGELPSSRITSSIRCLSPTGSSTRKRKSDDYYLTPSRTMSDEEKRCGSSSVASSSAIHRKAIKGPTGATSTTMTTDHHSSHRKHKHRHHQHSSPSTERKSSMSPRLLSQDDGHECRTPSSSTRTSKRRSLSQQNSPTISKKDFGKLSPTSVDLLNLFGDTTQQPSSPKRTTPTARVVSPVTTGGGIANFPPKSISVPISYSSMSPNQTMYTNRSYYPSPFAPPIMMYHPHASQPPLANHIYMVPTFAATHLVRPTPGAKIYGLRNPVLQQPVVAVPPLQTADFPQLSAAINNKQSSMPKPRHHNPKKSDKGICDWNKSDAHSVHDDDADDVTSVLDGGLSNGSNFGLKKRGCGSSSFRRAVQHESGKVPLWVGELTSTTSSMDDGESNIRDDFSIQLYPDNNKQSLRTLRRSNNRWCCATEL